jgi:hypothetical protein
MRFVGDIALDAEVRAIASGAITDGAPVLVNADGTVSLASDVSAIGTAVVYDADQVFFPSAVYDTNADRIVIAYQDGGNSYYGTAIVGTISGTSINFGSPVVFKSANTRMFNASFDINANKIVIVYRDSNPGRAIVATVDPSDNSISFGSEATYDATKGNDPHIAYDVNAQKHLITYYDTDEDGRAIVGTVSGTDITFGSSSEFETEDTREPNVIYDVNAQKHLIFYLQYLSGGTDTPAKARVATISGTSVSFGTIATISTNVVDTLAGAYDVNAQKSVLVYRDQTSSTAKARVATISGTSVSFGTEAEFDDGQAVSNDATYDASLQKTVFTFKDQGNSSKGSFKSGTISGTDITFGSTIVFEEGSTSYTSVNYDPDSGKNIVAFVDAGDSSKGKAIVINSFNPISLTSENFIGFANAAYADGQKATVKTTGSIARNVPQVPSASSVVATAVIFEAAATKVPDVCFDSTNNRIVVAYQDDANSDYGTAIVGTVASDGSISFGTPVVFESAATGGSGIAIVHDSNSNKIVIAYEDEGNSQYGTAIVGTVDSSDNSISFGSAAVFESGEATTIDACFDSNSNKVVIAYSDAGNSQYGKAVVGTVSGTSISFGSIVTFESAQTDYVSIAFDSTNNKVIIAYADGGDSGKGKAVVGTVSGTDISFGTVVTFENADTRWTSLAHDSSNQKTVIAYHDAGNSDYPTAIVGTVSGTDISFGTPVVIQSTANYGTATTFDSNINKIIITYNDNTGKDLRIIDGTVSGTSISFGTNAFLIEATSLTSISAVAGANHAVRNVFDSNVNKTISVYSEFRNSSYGTARATTSAGTPEDLTIGQQYFVQTDGTLGTSADDPSVIAGTAIGTSELIVKG